MSSSIPDRILTVQILSERRKKSHSAIQERRRKQIDEQCQTESLRNGYRRGFTKFQNYRIT
jgi:hypothetical protein